MKFILQKIANYIIRKMEKSSKEKIAFWYNVGILLDSIATSFGVELE